MKNNSKKEHPFKFDAFITYSHKESKVAKRLQTYLQRCRLPKRHRRLQVYLDQTDIRGGDLSGELTSALNHSKTLMVCCSPAAYDSKWVQKEIGTFGEARQRPIIPILLAGDPEKIIPASILRQEKRYIDLRRGKWLGIFSPKARIEIARAIAAITDLPLRDLVDWERKRQRKIGLRMGVVFVLLLAVLLFFPRWYTHEINVKKIIGNLRTAEFAEVQNDSLIVMAREIMEAGQGKRNYVACYSNILESKEWKWLDEAPFSSQTRLLHFNLLNDNEKERLSKIFNLREIRKPAKAYADQRSKEVDEENIDFSPRGPWAGEPRPNLFIFVYVIPPIPIDLLDEPYSGPPAGDAVVIVAEPGKAPKTTVIAGLDPARSQTLFGPKSTNLHEGIPVAAAGNELWLGMAARDDGRTGGLWHSPDAGQSWKRVKQFNSIASIGIDPKNLGRIFLATATGRWKSSVREGTLDTELWERPGPESRWRLMKHAPPYSACSLIQIVGFFGDGALAIQVDSSIYELGKDSFARRLFGSYRR